MSKRSERQAIIREIVREREVWTQQELVELLETRGHACTQATVSRDITEMGLERHSEGGYALPEDLHLHRMLSDLMTSVARANNLVVVKCRSGAGASVGAAIDGAALAGILGSIAGDDTILLICQTDKVGENVVSHLERFRKLE